MLLQMDIENLVTIEKSSISFSTGLTTITGETGTGKSILMDAIDLALGGRATPQLIRTGCERADISLCFDIRHLLAAKKWLTKHDLENNGECILRRTLTVDGRSRSYVNNVPIPITQLRSLSEHLMQMHGQQTQHTLLQSDQQLILLDEFAGIQTSVNTLRTIAHEYKSLQEKITLAMQQKEKFQAEQNWLQLQLNEFESFHLETNTFQQLDQLHRQLSHAETLLQQTKQAHTLLATGENNALELLQKIIIILENIQHADRTLTEMVNTLQTTCISLKEVAADLRAYPEKCEIDPARLTQIDKQMSDLFHLARKYKIAPEQLFSYQENIIAQLNQATHFENEIHALLEQSDATQKKYLKLAAEISEKRKIAAEKLTHIILQHLKPLALEKANFYIQLEPNNTPFSATGQEKVRFLISTHPGQSLQPLNTVASGGELSRIGLAIYAATATKHNIPTLIFDEIDSGIGGGTAEKVGKLLRQLGTTHQILCITHAPQVAVQGHQHLMVQKIMEQNKAYSITKMLRYNERIEEIARMLGGVEITEKTLAHAREMMNSAQVEVVE